MYGEMKTSNDREPGLHHLGLQAMYELVGLFEHQNTGKPSIPKRTVTHTLSIVATLWVKVSRQIRAAYASGR